jgi:DNA-binding GntR family transcriptional regulator
MARQLAELLAGSDLDELREVVARWRQSAASEHERQTYSELASRLIELKAELSRSPVQPTREELEAALVLMLRLAAQHGR